MEVCTWGDQCAYFFKSLIFRALKMYKDFFLYIARANDLKPVKLGGYAFLYEE